MGDRPGLDEADDLPRRDGDASRLEGVFGGRLLHHLDHYHVVRRRGLGVRVWGTHGGRGQEHQDQGSVLHGLVLKWVFDSELCLSDPFYLHGTCPAGG